MLVAWYWGELVLTFLGNGSNGRRESDVEDDSGYGADLGFGAISRNLILTCVQQSDIGNSLDTPKEIKTDDHVPLKLLSRTSVPCASVFHHPS
jgi:hypothetical protein